MKGWRAATALFVGVALVVFAAGFGVTRWIASSHSGDIHKIKHVIVVMQENRSFDSYFGTFPGADGIPMRDGRPTVCSPDPETNTCQAPFPDHADTNAGGPHGASDARNDIARGKMNGFVAVAQKSLQSCRAFDPSCAPGVPDVMGYHTQSDIPNYWRYANDFVLQDHMFEPNASWSLPEHLFQVSEWSAHCTAHRAASCTNMLQIPSVADGPPTDWENHPAGSAGTPIYAWTDLTYLLHKHNVSWGYYVATGTEPDCSNDAAMSCPPVRQSARTPGIWNPLPYFDTVKDDGQLGNIQSVTRFYDAARAGTLPAVSWVVPAGDTSEHPPAAISAGQSYVTSLVNAVMRGPDWDSTAIFVSWDDWGGFYDHVRPPVVDENGYGLRVPGIMISPYAKRGDIDHQTLSFDAYVKFIEDDFLGGQRIDPKTDGRPDPRPDVRENAEVLGDLTSEFDFSQAPRPPEILDVHPHTTLAARPPLPATFVNAVPGNRRAQVRWSTPQSDGGSAITGYLVTVFHDGVAQAPVRAGAAARAVTITGLTNGQRATFAVAAVNAAGTGPPSPQTQPFNVGAPTEPRALRARVRGENATITWRAPASDNGASVSGYIVIAYDGLTRVAEHEAGANVRSLTFSRLERGVRYEFAVVATNANGSGARATIRA